MCSYKTRHSSQNILNRPHKALCRLLTGDFCYKKQSPGFIKRTKTYLEWKRKKIIIQLESFFLLISLLVLPLQKKLTASVARRREEEEEEEGNDKDRVKEFLGRAE